MDKESEIYKRCSRCNKEKSDNNLLSVQKCSDHQYCRTCWIYHLRTDSHPSKCIKLDCTKFMEKEENSLFLKKIHTVTCLSCLLEITSPDLDVLVRCNRCGNKFCFVCTETMRDKNSAMLHDKLHYGIENMLSILPPDESKKSTDQTPLTIGILINHFIYSIVLVSVGSQTDQSISLHEKKKMWIVNSIQLFDNMEDQIIFLCQRMSALCNMYTRARLSDQIFHELKEARAWISILSRITCCSVSEIISNYFTELIPREFGGVCESTLSSSIEKAMHWTLLSFTIKLCTRATYNKDIRLNSANIAQVNRLYDLWNEYVAKLQPETGKEILNMSLAFINISKNGGLFTVNTFQQFLAFRYSTIVGFVTKSIEIENTIENCISKYLFSNRKYEKGANIKAYWPSASYISSSPYRTTDLLAQIDDRQCLWFKIKDISRPDKPITREFYKRIGKKSDSKEDEITELTKKFHSFQSEMKNTKGPYDVSYIKNISLICFYIEKIY
jgi:hypothetical protein